MVGSVGVELNQSMDYDLDLVLDLQVELSQSTDADLPVQAELEQWVKAALEGTMDEAELTIRLVENGESAALNQQYRDKPGPTNVLSFPFEAPADVPLPLLGDIIICAPLVVQEAQAQGKTVRAHWAHLVVHGVLHLRGYDHTDDGEAREMEDLERKIMAYLEFDDPYMSDSVTP
ncbi:Metal-dependent hydrolase YbeY, involved in rRNA and/or ribosome maturation and assembly [hydrothermal vent metagenome]|uniref:Metal-dependent hydrolase YbeY, involved in rRNA and/or ribosome maturation and assembly n=1 Tax=hydrothermal vent metagenome TaxID=652676 RepID=A0A3B0ZAW7_9ZZZZ